MALTAAQKVAIKRHLGMNSAAPSWYPYVDPFVAVGQILETLPAATEAECVVILTRLAAIETSLDAARSRLKAEQVGSIKLNGAEIRQLRGELNRWRAELSILLGVPRVNRPGQIVVT